MSKSVTLIITLEPNGDVAVSGPTSNKMLCYSLLELGRDCIKDYHDERLKNASKIAAPTTDQILQIGKGAKPQ